MITAAHSCCCITCIAPHVLRTLDRPVCNANRTLPHSPSTLSLSTSDTTTQHRLGPYFFIPSSSWLPRGPANLHRALVLRLSLQVQCSSPCRFHWITNMLLDTPILEDTVTIRLPLSIGKYHHFPWSPRMLPHCISRYACLSIYT